jgi:hypothetical protein
MSLTWYFLVAIAVLVLVILSVPNDDHSVDLSAPDLPSPCRNC